MNKIKSIILQIALVIGIVFAIRSYQSYNLISGNLENQQILSLEGKKVNLWEANKKNLIFFFAPWCSVCKMNMDSLDSIANKDTHVVAVALSYNSKEEVALMAKPLIKKIPILLGDNSLLQKTNISIFPTILFVNQLGKISGKTNGFITTLEMKIRLWLTM